MPVIIAGNLRSHKAGYVYQLPDNCSFNLFGVGYEGKVNDKVNYLGAFDSDELPNVLAGSFGLVWDGGTADTCSGTYGEYLKINNPHKTSLYLAAGIPVIIWSQAALAEFIGKHQCGLTVNSLAEIKEKINGLSEEDYEKMKKNAEIVSEKLRGGYYLLRAIDTCLEKE